MNLIEFNALKPGDKIENAMSNSSGEVTEVSQGIVKVRWNAERLAPGGQTGIGLSRTYSVHSTIWFHWSKADEPSAPCHDAEFGMKP